MQVYFTLQAVFQDEEEDRDTSFVSENTDSLYLPTPQRNYYLNFICTLIYVYIYIYTYIYVCVCIYA